MEKLFIIPEKTLVNIIGLLETLPYKTSAGVLEMIKNTIKEHGEPEAKDEQPESVKLEAKK